MLKCENQPASWLNGWHLNEKFIRVPLEKYFFCAEVRNNQLNDKYSD